MGGFAKGRMVLCGAVIAVVGLLAIAIPAFTTMQTKDVARIGDLKLTAQEETWHVIPPFVGPAALAVGVILMGAGFVVRG